MQRIAIGMLHVFAQPQPFPCECVHAKCDMALRIARQLSASPSASQTASKDAGSDVVLTPAFEVKGLVVVDTTEPNITKSPCARARARTAAVAAHLSTCVSIR